ncbi:hypothetical protein HO932_05300 [Streptococcus suis]|nr:hypothetical protein [Streptococcus suis]NQN95515.1 hypothetical protein [Streptococcus suis]NQO34592.1 hypothetical protein [Streptococcus suis]NQO44689.1 hypothetical protein [Streptococcus suis]NQO55347.1 hypothetical protein [Streptococcus suis]
MSHKSKRVSLNVTSTGFKFRLDQKRLGNYELVEAIAEAEDNPLKMPIVVKLLLGDAQAKLLKEHCRDSEGFVSTEKLMDEVKYIFKSQQVKN